MRPSPPSLFARGFRPASTLISSVLLLSTLASPAMAQTAPVAPPITQRPGVPATAPATTPSNVSTQPIAPVAAADAPADEDAPPSSEMPADTAPLQTPSTGVQSEPTPPFTRLVTAPPAGSQTRDPNAPPADAQWVVNFERAETRTEAGGAGESLGILRPYTYLQVWGYEEDWAKVYNPRTRLSSYIRSASLGPTDAPPSYITAPPPPAVEEINLPGRVVTRATVSFFPTPAEEAQTSTLGHNASVFILDSVQGEDGELWYRTSEGDYLPSANVVLPRPAARTFSGRWIDANLNEPAMLTAYEDDRVIMTTLTIKGAGRFQTPTGVFSIQRRVANETMSSETIGIPRNGPGGYHLTNVLYTQYFLGSGESIHYNYWSSVWGYQGSHGCLGLPYEESEFLWRWANVGTPVSIHY